VYVVTCSVCRGTVFAGDLRSVPKEFIDTHEPEQIFWPQPKQFATSEFPSLVASALDDALSCYNAGVYSACAVMCGKALEAICADKTRKRITIAEGLRQLRKDKIIDEMLFDWGDLLRRERNIGAHANREVLSQRDAEDVLEFVHAISEYVYILSKKYKNYLKRKPPPKAPGAAA
jgi:hypothetical protein